MSLPKERYKQYIEPGADSSQIPRSTYYRGNRRGTVRSHHVPEPLIRHNHNQNTPLQPEVATSTSQSPLHDLENNILTLPQNNVEHSIHPHEDLHDDITSSCPSTEEENFSDQDYNELDQVSATSHDSDVDSILSFCNDSSDDSLLSEHLHECPSQYLLSNSLAATNLNTPLAPSLSVTKFETLLMIFHLVMRHAMTAVFLEDMFRFVNTLVGDDDAIPGSKFLFHKLFLEGKKLDIHFFCADCEIYLGPSSLFKGNEIVCDECKTVCTVSSMNNGNFFIAMSIKDQLENILKRVNGDMTYPVDNRQEGVISDIFDGHIYKGVQQFCVENNQNPPLTITFNTDVSPVYKSSKTSLWPVQFLLNEINPSVRFNLENVVLGGLWFGPKSPDMHIFLKPFVAELDLLRLSGVTWTQSNGIVIESPVYAICCSIDSVAKPMVQNHHQFNGKYGCGYCLHPGNSVLINPANGFSARRFLANEIYPDRTDRLLRKDMRLASLLPANSREEHVNGSLGISPVMSLPLFNVVYGFGIDYVHAALEGVMERLCDLWFLSKNRFQKFYIGNALNIVNERMSTIRPPSCCLSPRPMTDRAQYKANEWRSFLLFYSLPCLNGILPELFYNHFKKFVSAIFVLTQDTISTRDLQKVDFLLYEFVWDFGDLYGKENMVYNVHLLLHFGKMVAMQGPLWAYSTFRFESGNGRLVKLVKGTTGVATQIARKYLMACTVAELILGNNYKVSDSIFEFCNDITCFREQKNAVRVKNIVLLGKVGLLYLTEEEKFLIHPTDPNVTMIEFCSQAIKDGVMYHGRRFTRQERFDDSCVKLENGELAVLDLIFLRVTENGNDVFCLARCIRLTEDNENEPMAHVKKICIDSFGPLQMFPFSGVVKKCVLIDCNSKLYVSEFPNNFEKD